ncbi:HEAT repeat protein [Xylariomycetidae sp. FL0641]|nr:HEAT repeat protein [Xylariomycetidae sp. FL0641]
MAQNHPPSSAARNEFFKQLKPQCVSINHLAVRSADKKAAAKDLIKVTEDLSAILERQLAQDASVLDEKLADYIFFPLSNILRNQQHYPIRLTEITIRCLRLLLQHGWKSKVPKDLAQQLLILLTFIIAGVPGQEKNHSIPEETELESFKALASLIQASGSSPAGAAALVEESAIPALGHAVTVVLDGITDGKTPDIQLEALQTLHALLAAIKDQAALATFLPGIVSSLSRLLAPPASLKTQRKVLIKALAALQQVLTKVLGDMETMALTKKATEGPEASGPEGKVFTPAWLKATVAKVQLALASVFKLRNHPSEDIQAALEKLCITLLDECHQSLASCNSILVETAMMLYRDEENKSVFETSLTDLARIYPELGDTIKNTVYNWVITLPRAVQSNDEKVKQQALRNVLKGQHFLDTLQIDSSILDDSLAASLRDSTTALVLATKPEAALSEVSSQAIELKRADLVRQDDSTDFPPVLIALDTERSTRSALLDFISKLGPVPQRAKLAGEMLASARESDGPSQVASYWLAFELVKSTSSPTTDLDDFLDLSTVADLSDESETIFHELYAFSVGLLDSQAEGEDSDWRMQALALEVTTFTASKMQESFRPELIDVLYPIAAFLGSDVPRLREHAIVSLNSISGSCGYLNVTDLIIDNVDYMVNSVSLRLNTFDISPASTQVLQMMIRLTGPKLIPYLDDVVASIFAALDNYHGYTLFVENLFGVLREVVEQGIKSDSLLIEDTKSARVDHKKTPTKEPSTEVLCDLLVTRRQNQEQARQEEVAAAEESKKHPQRPWKEASDAKPADGEDDEMDDDDDGPPAEPAEKEPPPPTPTFQLLARIVALTQHYLTSPGPGLRKALLELVASVAPALAPAEPAFLPLVHALWPVLADRLLDPEPFVVAAACDALAALAAAAGDFLAQRFATEWWDRLGRWARRARAEAARYGKGKKKNNNNNNNKQMGTASLIPVRRSGETGGGGSALELDLGSVSATTDNTGLGQFAQAARVWEAAKRLLVAFAAHVRLDDAVFDQLLDLLADDEALRPGAVREALLAVDPDAVWLLAYERGVLPPPMARKPEMPGVVFVDI